MSCVRCGRPACPDCLREASVGYQCVDCVRSGARDTRVPKTVAGARLGGRSVIVPLLILANVVVFVITVIQAGSLNNNANSALFENGAEWPPYVVVFGQWWRLLTAGFLHYGPVHLVLNMASLYFVGRDLELVLGRLRFSALYLVSLFGGGVSVFLLGDPRQLTAGASGAIFGLLGALLVVVCRMKLNVQPVIMVIALNVVLSLVVPNISLLAHLGGLVVGALAAIGLVFPKPERRAVVQVGTFTVLTAALVLLFLVRLAEFTPGTA